MNERFDFSTKEAQQDFLTQSPAEQERQIIEAQDEALMLNEQYDELIKLLDDPYPTRSLSSSLKKYPEELFSIPAIAVRFARYLIQCVNQEQYDELSRCLTTIRHFETVIQSPEEQAAAKAGLVSLLRMGDSNAAKKLSDTFNLPETEVQAAAEARLVTCLRYRYIDDAKKLSDTFNLPETVVQAAAEAGLVSLLRDGYINDAKKLSDTFNLPETVIQSPEVQAAAEDGLVSLLRDGYIDDAKKLSDTFNLPETEVQAAAEARLVTCLRYRYIDDAKKLSDTFNLPETVVQAAAEAGLVSLLRDGYINDAKKLSDTFNLPETVIQSPEVQAAAEARLVTCLRNRYIDDAKKLSDTFNLPETVFNECVAKACIQAIDVGRLLAALKLLKMYEDQSLVEKMTEKLISLGSPLTPERAWAILETDRFGVNLLGKFGEFDAPAKAAVSLILTCDESIPAELDRRSPAYRQAVLEQVLDFKRNSDIAKHISEAGIDIETWLHYEQIDYFTLGEADKLTTAEMIKTPVERLAPSFQAFTTAMREVIGEYRKELFVARVPIDVSGLENDREALKQRLKQVTDPNKRAGILKGLASIQAQIEQPKLLPVWDKVMAEFSKLVKLSESITGKNIELDKLEKNSISITNDETLEAAQVQKARVWQLKTALTKELEQLERRSGHIFTTLQEALIPALGAERAAGIRQEVQSAVAEHIDHLSSDFATIFSFIREPEHEGDEEVPDEMVMDDSEYTFNPVHAKKLEGRAMSIRVAGRSRQDLYTGNYTTCCIRIDSEYHQAESPIADYLTDVGMQNILIYDETTKTPVACAWCWLGYHHETGEPALVIDNVEGWQKYTVNFQSQLNERLLAYLNNYAKTIGVKVLTQGPDYNDLNPIPADQQTEQYLKIGGSNRPDEQNGVCGYYLEAEYVGGGSSDEEGEEWDAD